MRRTLVRSRVLPILVILAAMLAPALVASGAEAAPKSKYRVGITLSDTNVTKGKAVLVTGKVRPATAGKVLLQRRKKGSWSTLRKIKLVASTYAANVRMTETGVTFLRVVAPGGKGHRKGVSKVRTVRVLNHATNPQIATPTLPDGALGDPYSAQVKTSDDRAGTWSIGAGALPPGLSINRSTGVISGTPTAGGASQFGVYFRDTDRRVSAKVFTVTIDPDGPVISTTTLPGASLGAAYTAQLQTVGNLSGTWSVTTGSLPAGLTLDGPTGSITGTPTAAGKADFTVRFQATGGDPVGTRALSIVVSASPPVISTATLPAGKTSEAYTAKLTTADGRAGTWTIASGALPAGLTLNGATGVISGTPTASGTSDFTVKFTDSEGGSVTKPLSIKIQTCILFICF